MRRKKILWLILVVAVTITALASLFISLFHRDEINITPFAFPDQLGEEWLQEIDDSRAGSVIIPGQKNITVTKDGKVIDSNFCNPIENDGLYLMMFALVSEENPNQAFYVSEPLAPGNCAEDVTIGQIDDAEDKVNILIQPYRMDTGTKTNGASISVLLLKNLDLSF